MLKPGYLDALPDAMVELYAQVEADILADMARRISTYDYYIPAAQWQHVKAQELGLMHDEIIKQMSQATGKSQSELRKMFSDAGGVALAEDDKIYRRAGLKPSPVNASPELLEVLNAGYNKTYGTFKNLTKTTARTAIKQFENALDRAYMQITSGAFDANVAVRMAVKNLAGQGMGAIRYPSGHVDTIEVATRRAIVTGVSQTAGLLSETRAGEMGCDLMEITAHSGARPDHARWQGQIVSLSGRKGYLSKQDIGYGSVDGFKGANCRHDWYPFFNGISKRAYTEHELKQLEAKTITYNDVRMTEYEALQNQRYIERQIRRWKRENQAMAKAGLDTGESAAKIKQWQDRRKDFTRQTGLKRQADREQIPVLTKPKVRRIMKPSDSDIYIGKGLGAEAFRDKVLLPGGGKSKLAEGTKITKVVTFAGKGTKKPVRIAEHLSQKYGGKPDEWKKVRGEGVVQTPSGKRRAELHWFENPSTGRVEMKVKRWFD